MSRALLVDVSGLFWMAWHAGADKELSFAYQSVLDRVQRWASHYRAVGICIDTGPYLRKQISASYKAQRDAPEPAAIEQFRRVKERLAADYHCFAAPGYEADDIIATIVSQWRLGGCLELEGVDILSSDKDLLQLVTEKVACVSPATDKRYGIDDVVTKFGVHPELVRDLLALTGDTSDNIPGVKGVGIKTAAKLLKEHGTLVAICDAASRGRFTPALGKALIEAATPGPDGVTPLELSARLVTLMTDAPGVQWETMLEAKAPSSLIDVGEPEDFENMEDEMPNDETDPGVGANDVDEPIGKPPVRTAPAATQEAEFDSAPRQTAPKDKDPRQESDREPTEAIVRADQPWSLALEPRGLQGALWLGKVMQNSRLYTKFPNAEAIMAIIIRGRELGLGAMTALDQFHVVEGHPTMHAHLIVGLCKKHDSCEYFQLIESTATRAVYETKRRGEPKETRMEYTIEEAAAAGLTRPSRNGKPSNWTVRPKTMLRKQAAVELARAVYPDVVGGLYDPDEFQSDEAAA